MRSRNSFLISVALIATCTAIAVAAFRNQAQKGIGGQDGTDQSSWPLTDYSVPKSADPEMRARRENRGKKYDKSMFRVHPRDPAENTVRTQSFDPYATLPALPVTQSSAVVIGEVIAAQAYLSNDQTGVYSEFNIRLDDVLKSVGSHVLAIGCQIDLEREGGRVKFPSGRVHWYSVDKENMPRVGRRYLFFLTRDGNEQIFHVLTAYELRGAKVFPLDELPQFKAHAGENEFDFITAVRTLLAASSQRGS